MNTAIVQTPTGDIERVLALGDLSRLSPDDRADYYSQLCRSLGLNPLTRPFEYLTLNGKLTLYARKDATDQLRRVYGVSIAAPSIVFQEGWVVVTVSAHLPDGRTDSDVGVVSLKDMRGDFGNVVMKAVTKAKRRVTLSICGLGLLDETEVETIPNARPLPAPEPATVETIPAPVCSECGAAVKERAAEIVRKKAGAVLCKTHYDAWLASAETPEGGAA